MKKIVGSITLVFLLVNVAQSQIVKDSVTIKPLNNLLSMNVLGLYNHIGISYEHLNSSRFTFGVNASAFYAGYQGIKGEAVLRYAFRKKERSSTYILSKMGFGVFSANYYYHNQPALSRKTYPTAGLGVGLGHRFFVDKSDKWFLDLYMGAQAYLYYSSWSGLAISDSHSDQTEIKLYGKPVNAFNYWTTFGPGSFLDLRVNLGYRF